LKLEYVFRAETSHGRETRGFIKAVASRSKVGIWRDEATVRPELAKVRTVPADLQRG
jgi:hypothetical protein